MAKGLAAAYDNLSTLLAAGVPLIRSLNSVSGGLHGNLRWAFQKVTEGIRKGLPLTDAMRSVPRVFALLDIMIIQAAEESGSLAESFQLLGQWYEFSTRMKRRIFSGLALPILVIHLAAFLIPLPLLVTGGWDFNAFFISILSILAVPYSIAALIICTMRYTPQTGTARKTLDHIALRIPGLGRAVQRLALSRYCWIFHTTCKAGMPVTRSAEMAMKGTGNAVIAAQFAPALASVKAGNPFSEGLDPSLPAEFVERWRIGEESGNIDDITKRLAEKNGEDAEFWFKQFSTWFPWIVYGIVLLVVAGVVITQFLRLYSNILNMNA